MDTRRWYDEYQAVVRCVPAVGMADSNYFYVCLGEIYDIAIVIENEIVFVAIVFKEPDDPLLLFRCEHAFATIITIIGTMTAQIFLQLFS